MILPFGLLGSKEKIFETTKILLKYATFSGGFLMFAFNVVASALKSYTT